MTLRIYIAGPMRAGLEKGIHAAVKAAEEVAANGMVPFLPQLQALWNIINPKEDIYGYFLPMDYAWIEVCDALLRLPGESKGSDAEIEFCKKIGKPVFYSMTALREWKDSLHEVKVSVEEMDASILVAGWTSYYAASRQLSDECLNNLIARIYALLVDRTSKIGPSKK